MKKTVVSLALLGALTSSNLFAHDLWANATGKEGQVVQAQIGYGHDFPKAEPIPEKRTVLFNPMRITSSEGTETLMQKGENYQYVGQMPLKKGSHLVSVEYKPTFWVQKMDGSWEQGKTRVDIPDAKLCEQAVMFGKTVLNVGKSSETFSQPIGHALEIIPIDDPANYRVGKPFTVQVLFRGKPLKTQEVTGTFAGFPKDQKAFLGRTDLEGKIAIMPLGKGQWMLKAQHSPAFEDAKICDKYEFLATLTVQVQ